GMALLSLGAAVENLMLAAATADLASCWVAAPIFCPAEARDALSLARDWLPHALVLVGRPDPAYTPPTRPPPPLDDLRAFARPARAPDQVSKPARREVSTQPPYRRVPTGTARNQSKVRRSPSSRSVHGCHPRWFMARAGSRAERWSSPGRAIA